MGDVAIMTEISFYECIGGGGSDNEMIGEVGILKTNFSSAIIQSDNRFWTEPRTKLERHTMTWFSLKQLPSFRTPSPLIYTGVKM